MPGGYAHEPILLYIRTMVLTRHRDHAAIVQPGFQSLVRERFPRARQLSYKPRLIANDSRLLATPLWPFIVPSWNRKAA